MLAIHSETSRAYCLVVMPLPDPRPPGEHKFAGLLGCCSHVIVDNLASLFRQLEPDGLPGFLLPNRGPIDGVSAWRNILDLEADEIAAAELAIDGHIEHR
jgi:hypothetical protein